MKQSAQLLALLSLATLFSCKQKAEEDVPVNKFTITCATTGVNDLKESSATLTGAVAVSGNAPDKIETCFYLGTDIVTLKTLGRVVPGGFVSAQGGRFSASISDLTPGTTYYYAASAFGKGFVSYGDVTSFETPQKELVKTLGSSEVSYYSAVLSGFADLAHAETKDFGFLVSKSENPTSDNSIKFTGKEIGNDNTYTVLADNLEDGVTYYFRAFVGNTPMHVGNVMSFTTPKYIPVASITVIPSELKIPAGESQTLTVSFTPENASDKTTTWSSSDIEIATVDDDGNVYGVSEGESTITALAGEASSSCRVIVFNYIPVTSVSLDYSKLALVKGNSKRLVVTVEPEDATDKNVSWSSSDNSVATVDNEGTVKAINAGETVVTAKVGDLSTTCSVKVYETSVPFIVFADPSVKEALVKYIDTDGDGEISYEEATSASYLPPLKKDIVSFDEFQYFTGITEIPNTRFEYCQKLTSIVLPESITRIGNSSFHSCKSLTRINIPKSVTDFGSNCFSDCSSLTSIEIPEGITTLGPFLFSGCHSLTEVSIPESVSSMGEHCFSLCRSLKKITIPNSVHIIPRSCFLGCSNLLSITIPEGVTELRDYCFSYCDNLSTIVLPSSVCSIGDDCFSDCERLETVVLSNKITHLGPKCFFQCVNLSSINLDSINTIGDYCFFNCDNLHNVSLSNSLETLGEGAFRYSALKSIILPDSVKSVGAGCFSHCDDLESIRISISLKELPEEFLFSCGSIKTIDVPEGVESIGNKCFYGNNLVSVSLPASLIRIGSKAITSTKLTTVTIKAKVPPTASEAGFIEWNNSKRRIDIYVPAESVATYKAAEYWKEYTSMIKAIP